MATVGLVGGLGPESTVDYYKRIIAGWQQRHPASAPSLVIDSLDVQRALRLVASDRAGLVAYLLGSLQRLAAAGADFTALTANTRHLVFDELAAQFHLPIISIVEACANAAHERGLRRLALLGTRFTMEAPFYPATFAKHSMDVVAPDDSTRTWVHAAYTQELLVGDFRDETRERLVGLIRELRRREHIDGVILGGTELPLLLRAPEIDGVPLLDTTALHVDAIVQRLG